jgi:hypothetical protein
MGRHLGFVALSQKVYTKIVILLCLILILGSAGIAQMVFAIPEYLDNGLNPIPYSPAPPRNQDKVYTSGVSFENGYRVYNSGEGWRAISPEPSPTGETVPAKLNAYAACKSVNEISGNTIVIDNMFRLGYNSQTGLRTSSLLMYPQIKDIIPPVATINSAILVSSQKLLNGIFMPIEAYEITSNWDPRTFNGPMPTLSQQPIGTGVFDENSSTATNRTVDVTTTVQNWFNGTSSQWGFYIRTSSSSSINNEYLNPPRLYIDYTMPEGSFSTRTVSGGTWYNDGICPGMWIPRRATYIAKEGILGNDVQTSVYAATTMDAPFGYDNQSFRWVIGGKPNNTSVDYQPCDLNIEIESTKFLSNMIWRIPAINNKLFSMGPFPPPTTQPYPPPDTPIHEAGTDGPEPPPSPDKDDGDDDPSDDPQIFVFCDFWKKWVPDHPPDVIFPPPITPDPAICSSNPPILKMPPEGSLETYSWNATKNQWVTFKNNNPSFSDLSKIAIGSNNWLSEITKPNLSGRISPGGISDLSYAPSLGPIINNDLFSTSSSKEKDYKSNTITAINGMPPPPGHWSYGNDNLRIVKIYLKRWGQRTLDGDSCINCDPIGNPPQQPHSSDSVEAYDTKLPYPEIIQSNNIGYGNNETALDKEIFTGPGYAANPLNGAVEHKYVDFSIPIHGNLNLEFSRSYSSIMGNVGSILGLGWSTNIDEKYPIFKKAIFHTYHPLVKTTYLPQTGTKIAS